MKSEIISNTNNPEGVRDCLIFSVTALRNKRDVRVFSSGNGVEIEEISDEKYNVKEQTNLFIENRGQILACRTCLKSRKKESSEICPISTMKDLLKLVEESDRVLTFG